MNNNKYNLSNFFETLKSDTEFNTIYSENIELYKNSASIFFMENCINKTNEDGTINKLYYSKFLTDSLIAGLNDIDTNEAFTLFKDKAKDYIRTEKSLKTNIIKYLIGCNKDQINVIQYHWYEIEDNFISIKDFIRAIDYYKVTNETLKAIKLKQYIVSKLKLIVRDLEFFHIYLTETPIEAKINNLITEFENSIDINEINQIEALKNQPQQVENIKTDEVIKYNWFIIGLKFANGEMKTLLKTHNNNATKIADKLGNKDGFRPYISESIGVKKNTSEKSIYSDYDKMKTIIEYCEVNKIEIQSEFLMRFEELEQEQ